MTIRRCVLHQALCTNLMTVRQVCTKLITITQLCSELMTIIQLCSKQNLTGSDILSLVEVQRWRHSTWGESDVIKFARNVNWISAHWLNSFKVSPEEYAAASLMVSFTFFICALSECFHILDQWKEMPWTRVMKVYPTCMLFTRAVREVRGIWS